MKNFASFCDVGDFQRFFGNTILEGIFKEGRVLVKGGAREYNPRRKNDKMKLSN
jgi:hypothetical protein